MNWKLVFSLSMFGLAMGLASLFGLTRGIEQYLWLVIFVLYAVWIVKHTHGHYFLHGLFVSFINGIWISIIHSFFFSTYIANNPEQLEVYEKMPKFLPPELMMLIVGPIFGLLFGLISGLFAFLAGKILKRNSPG